MKVIVKLALVISVQKTQFGAISYHDDLEESIRRAKDLGYDGVELAVRNPAEVDAIAIKALLDKYKLGVPAIGTGQAYVDEGLSFTDPDENIRRQAIERIKSHVRFAKRFGAGVIIGLIRGTVAKGSDKNVAYGRMEACLKECLQYAAAEQTKIHLEPLNRYETQLINTLDEGIALVDRVGGLKLLADTFHMNIEEPDICRSLRRAKPCLGHVHFADSNRWPPGQGHLDFAEILATLRDIGYDGYISMEMLPKPTAENAAQLAITHMQAIIQNS